MSDAGVQRKLSHTEEYIVAKNKVKNVQSVTNVTVTPIDSAIGYLGEYFHVDMTIKDKTGETHEQRFFLKTLPRNSWQTEFLTRNGLFEKEVNFYKDFSGRIRELISRDVYPESFLAVEGKIVLADVTLQGYRSLKNIVEPLDYEHTQLGLEALARFHAGSIIYEEKTGRKVGTDFPDLSYEANFTAGSRGMDFLISGGEAMTALVPFLDTNTKRDPEAVVQMQEQVGPWMEKLEIYLKENAPYRQVICHGDSWPANVLYRYDDQEKPLSAMLVDFQMTRLRSPAVDINTFMYLSVPVDDLKKWRESLLDKYYQVIVAEMRNCGLDAHAIYPKAEFLEAYIYYQKVGVIYAMMFFPFSRVGSEIMAEATSTSEKAAHFYYRDRKQHFINCYKGNSLLRRFVNGAVDEYYENFVRSKRGLTQFTK